MHRRRTRYRLAAYVVMVAALAAIGVTASWAYGVGAGGLFIATGVITFVFTTMREADARGAR